jgi:prolipoprotein diacylglyceryl transferase
MQTDHIVWNADPVAIDIGTIQLPFPIAIWGIVAAFAFIYFGYQKLMPDDPRIEADVPQWKFWGMIIGSFILGQLVFLVLPSPTFSEIGPIQPRWYGFLFAASFVAGYFITRYMFKVAGRGEEEVEQLLTYVLIATVVGARLGHVLFYDPSFYLRNPSEILAIWHGGLASHGAAIGILIAMYLYTKKKRGMSFLWLADRVVVVVALAGAFIRTGNFINSEIIGEPTDLPWGIVFAQRPDLGMIPRHPSMLYEAILCLIVFAVLWRVYRYYNEKPPEGSLFGIFLTFLFGGRFFLEYLKLDQAAFASGLFSMGQWLSIPLIVFGVWLMFKRVKWQKEAVN